MFRTKLFPVEMRKPDPSLDRPRFVLPVMIEPMATIYAANVTEKPKLFCDAVESCTSMTLPLWAKRPAKVLPVMEL